MDNQITETTIIRMLLYNTKFRTEVFGAIESFMFSDVHCSELFSLVRDYYDSYSKFPSGNIEVLICNNPWKQELSEIEDKLSIVRCEQDQYSNTEHETSLPLLQDWIKEKKFFRMIQESVNMYKEKRLDYSSITQQMNDIESFSFEEDDWVDSHDANYVLSLHQNTENRIKFASPIMNEMLDGGLKEQCLTIIMGGSHIGKSRALLSFATDLASVSTKRRILYITLEIDKDTVLESIDTHYFQMTNKDLRTFARQHPKEYIAQRKKIVQSHGKVIVQEFPANSVTANTIQQLLDKFKKRGVEFDAICVDYIALMSPIKEYNSLYEKGKTAVELRAISQKYKIPILTPTQPTKEGDKKSKAGGMGADLLDVAESKGIPETADVVLNLVMTVEQYKQNRQLLFWLKNRPGHRLYESLLLEIMPWYQVKILSFNNDHDEQQGAFHSPQTGIDPTIPEKTQVMSANSSTKDVDDMMSKFGVPSFGMDDFSM